MKSIHTAFLMGLVSLAVFSSCQKEISESNNILPGTITTPTNTVLTDSNYLDKIYIISGGVSSSDTQNIITFHYDSHKRVISMNDSVATLTGPGFFINNSYSYAGNDTVPYLSVWERNVGLSSPDSFITYHFYDASGRNLKDSSLYSAVAPDDYVVNYSYSPGKIYGQTMENSTGTPYYTRDTAIVDADGDILSNKISALIGGSWTGAISASFSYDTHKSPFFKLSNFKAQQPFPGTYEDDDTTLYAHMPVKNITNQTGTYLSGTVSITASYLYNTSGLPTRENRSVNGNSEIIIYTYKHL